MAQALEGISFCVDGGNRFFEKSACCASSKESDAPLTEGNTELTLGSALENREGLEGGDGLANKAIRSTFDFRLGKLRIVEVFESGRVDYLCSLNC
jgi:hypothetical protein